MADYYYFWLEESYIHQIASQTHHKYGCVHCLGCLDCAPFPFHTKPFTSNCGDFHGRKLGNVMSDIIASDENFLIRHLIADWPGRTHDYRILAHSKIWKKESEFLVQTNIFF